MILHPGLELIANVKQPIILVTEAGLEEETVTRLSRVVSIISWHLNGGLKLENAGFEVDTVNRISAEQFADDLKSKKIKYRHS